MLSYAPLPPNNPPHNFTQPNGTEIQLFLKGDHWFYYYEDENGCVANYNNESSEWKYVLPLANGQTQTTIYSVGNPLALSVISSLLSEKEQWIAFNFEQSRIIKEQQELEQQLPQYSPEGGTDTTSSFFDVAAYTDTGPQYSSPTIGTIKVPVLLANFSDTTPTFTQQQISSLFNDVGYGTSGSVRDFILENSYGQCTVQFDVYGWYNLPQTREYYGSDAVSQDRNTRQMVVDVVALATGIDFSQYSLQGNEIVSSLIVLHQGQGQELGGGTNAIWSHSWTMTAPVTTPDGVTKVYTYCSVPERFDATNITKIGVIAHEIGHEIFEFMDTYDTDVSSYGLGNWCTMAYGGWLNSNGGKPGHYSTYLKKCAGWVNPTVIRTDTVGVTLSGADQSADCVLIPVDEYEQTEYFLICNRYKRTTAAASTGFDQYIPGSGALIYHVNELNSGNRAETTPRVRVVEADGLWHMKNKSNQGDAGDVYVSGGILSPASNPNSNNMANVATGITISNFSGNGTNTMSFDVVVNPNILGRTIFYDKYGMYNTAVGYNGVDYGLLHATMPEGGTITRISTVRQYVGTINCTAKIYSTFTNNTPSNQIGGPYTGGGTGRGVQYLTVNPTIHLDAGTDFYVEILYDSGYMYPLVVPVVETPNSSGRSYACADGSFYFPINKTNATTYRYQGTYDINIRVNYIPDAAPAGPEREILVKLTTEVAGRLRRKRVSDGNVVRRYRPGEGTGREIIAVIRD